MSARDCGPESNCSVSFRSQCEAMTCSLESPKTISGEPIPEGLEVSFVVTILKTGMHSECVSVSVRARKVNIEYTRESETRQAQNHGASAKRNGETHRDKSDRAEMCKT